MCGNEFVPPLQGFELLLECETQGVALGCHVLRFQRARCRTDEAVEI